MASATELGITDQEFEDAMNLEKIYVLVNKGNKKCSKCNNTPTAVDCSTFQFLCSAHSVGRGNCKKIGDDRFTTTEVEKLCKRFGSSSSPRQPTSIKCSRSDKHRQSRRPKPSRRGRRHRSPSNERFESESMSSSGSDDEYVQPIKQTRSRSYKPHKNKEPFSTVFDDEFGMNQFQQSPVNRQRTTPPGMAGWLMPQEQNGGMYGHIGNNKHSVSVPREGHTYSSGAINDTYFDQRSHFGQQPCNPPTNRLYSGYNGMIPYGQQLPFNNTQRVSYPQQINPTNANYSGLQSHSYNGPGNPFSVSQTPAYDLLNSNRMGFNPSFHSMHSMPSSNNLYNSPLSYPNFGPHCSNPFMSTIRSNTSESMGHLGQHNIHQNDHSQFTTRFPSQTNTSGRYVPFGSSTLPTNTMISNIPYPYVSDLGNQGMKRSYSTNPTIFNSAQSIPNLRVTQVLLVLKPDQPVIKVEMGALDAQKTETVTVTGLTENLPKLLQRGRYICQICISRITRTNPLWSCDCCHRIFHLNCIHNWIKTLSSSTIRVVSESSNPSSTAPQASSRQELNSTSYPQPLCSSRFKWDCPSCRTSYEDNRLPDVVCWCRRFKNPPPSRYGTLTHSCGYPCIRRGPNACRHPCPLLCHPGPCPKCPVLLTDDRCLCGCHSRSIKCADKKEIWRCEKVCGKLLNCKVCHAGACAPCDNLYNVICLCGKETKSVLCLETINHFQCNNICGKMSPCQVHRCNRLCHKNDTSQADKDPTRKSLSEILSDSNNEVINTNPNNCSLLCSNDPSIVTHCPCGKQLLTKRDIRHTCSDPIPTCGEKCGKSLTCGHFCNAPCHEGLCDPCQIEVSVTCRCGRSKEKLPCHISIEKQRSTNGMITCKRVCNKTKSCGWHRCKELCCPSYLLGPDTDIHFCLQTCGKPQTCGNHFCDQFCHLGACPPCTVQLSSNPRSCNCGLQQWTRALRCGEDPPQCYNICGKARESCEHTCSALCHYGECPQCLVLVDKPCAGGHTIRQSIQCWINSDNIFCRQRCGKIVSSCEIHECIRLCHSGPCGPCRSLCNHPREFCSHTCQELCHSEISTCPDLPCVATVVVTCPCGILQKAVPCQVFSKHRDSPLPLSCDTSCKEEARRRILADAFETTNPVSNLLKHEVYDVELVTWAKHRYEWLCSIEDKLEQIIVSQTTGAQLPKQIFADLLWLSYLLETHYRLVTYYSRDPNENSLYLCVSYIPNESCVPQPKLSEVVKTFDGASLQLKTGIIAHIAYFGISAGGNTISSVLCQNRPSEITIREVRRRLQSLGFQYRLRWIPAISRPRLLKGKQRNKFSQRERFASGKFPSNLSLGECHLLIETIDADVAQKVLDIATGAPLFFGQCSLNKDRSKVISQNSKRVTTEVDEGGWRTI